jgi:hypothetical protein
LLVRETGTNLLHEAIYTGRESGCLAIPVACLRMSALFNDIFLAGDPGVHKICAIQKS